MKGFILIPIFMVLISGCVSNAEPVQTPVITTTPEPTFVSPTYHASPQTYTPVPVITPTVVTDEILGGWKLVGAKYNCDVVFSSGYNGHLSCGIFPIYEQRNFQWSNVGLVNGNKTYHMAVSEESGVVVATLLNNDQMIVDILPEGSYLVKTV